jgi:hypothetical protein
MTNAIACLRSMAGAFALGFSALCAAAPAAAQTAAEDTPPAVPEELDRSRIFLDTQVFGVAVDDRMTMVELAQSPESPCPMEEGIYVYSRERPKWLYQTGRLMQAQREGATIRISFSCIDGLQSINAVQFLSPPPSRMARTVPGRETSVEARAAAQAEMSRAPTRAAPLPTPASASPQGQRRTVPTPR